MSLPTPQKKTLEANYGEYKKFAHAHPWFTAFVLLIMVTPFLWSVYCTIHNWDFEKLRGKLSEKDTELAKRHGDIQKKDSEIQRLETLLTPFRTVALEKYAGTTETEALQKLAFKLRDLETTVLAISQYSQSARLNMIGKPFDTTAAGGLVIETDVSRLLQGTYTVTNNVYYSKYDKEAEDKYRQVVTRFPDYPFAYVYLADCLALRGDTNAYSYSLKALEILKQTTSIKQHSPDQDQIKSIVEKNVKSQP